MQNQTMQDNTQIVKKFFELFAKGDIEGIAPFFTEDVEYMVIGVPGAPPNQTLPTLSEESEQAIPWLGLYHGPEGAKEFVSHLQRNIEVLGFGPQEFIQQGNDMAVFGTFRYRARSTQRIMDTGYVIRIQMRDGKIALYRFYENTFAIAAAFRVDGSWVSDTDGQRKAVPQNG